MSVSIYTDLKNCKVNTDIANKNVGDTLHIEVVANDGYFFEKKPYLEIPNGMGGYKTDTQNTFILSKDKTSAYVDYTIEDNFYITGKAVLKYEAHNGSKFYLTNCTYVADTTLIKLQANEDYYFKDIPTIECDDGQGGKLVYKFTLSNDNTIATITNKHRGIVNGDAIKKEEIENGFITIYLPNNENLKAVSETSVNNASGNINLTDFIYRLYFTNIPIESIGQKEIYLGAIDCNTKSDITNKYNITIESSEIELPNVYNNVFDYSPYVKLRLYLPFIGFKDLDTNVVKTGKLKLRYDCNLYTMNCTCTVIVNGFEIDTYNGKCGFKIPYSFTAYTSNEFQVEDSCFSNDLTPKIIIIQSIPYKDDSKEFYGNTIEKYINKLSTLNGYNEIEKLFFSGSKGITQSEIEEINTLLSEGVYF